MELHMHRKIIIAILAVLALVFSVPAIDNVNGPDKAYAAGTSVKLSTAYAKAQKTVIKYGDDDNWRPDSAWIVIGLARAGALPVDAAEKYKTGIEEALNSADSDKLNEKQATDNARAILALTAIGADVTNIGGHNLLAPLSNTSYIQQQGINGPIWCLLALDCNKYEIPECEHESLQTTQEKLIDLIIGAQKTNKSGQKTGWAFSGSTADVDMTGMAITALAPYYKSNDSAKAAIDAALVWLADSMNKDGAFTSGGSVSSESVSQVIVALTSHGINPHKDDRFVKNSKRPLHGLLSFYIDGGFKHVSTNKKVNNLATTQAYYAMVSYYRFVDKQKSLYDMTDDRTYKLSTEGKTEITLTTSSGSSSKSSSSSSKKSSSKTSSSGKSSSSTRTSSAGTVSRSTSTTTSPIYRPPYSTAGRTTASTYSLGNRSYSYTPGIRTSTYRNYSSLPGLSQRTAAANSAGSSSLLNRSRSSTGSSTSGNTSAGSSSVARNSGLNAGSSDDDEESTGASTWGGLTDSYAGSADEGEENEAEAPPVNKIKQMPAAVPWVALGVLALGGLAAVLLAKRKKSGAKPINFPWRKSTSTT